MNEKMKNFLLSLCNASSPSGAEEGVREIIDQFIRPFAKNVQVDAMGNLIVTFGDPSRLLISAHMDEVGFMVTGIDSDGLLRFHQIGGVDPSTLAGKRVLFAKSGMRGVIGATPVHLNRNSDENGSYESLYIDIGAGSKEDAMAKVSVGDVAVFDTKSELFEGKKPFIKAKALDNRLGCYLLCDLIARGKIENGTCIFTVGEENGLRGVTAHLDEFYYPIGVALDTTTANDLPGTDGVNQISRLGGGPVISFADGATIYPRNLVRSVMECLEKANIPVQTKSKRTGGNEASAIEKVGLGALPISISVPCRYIHSCVGIALLSDVEATGSALAEILRFLKGESHA